VGQPGPARTQSFPQGGELVIENSVNQARVSGGGCICASRRLPGIPRVREAREGRPDLASYLAAKSSRRLLMNGSAFSARLRQRLACSFKKELSIFDSDTTNDLTSHGLLGFF
jgi:hypothetical protein